jgi:hypothetical protein
MKRIEKSVTEYLQLYINYKLKVQSAYDDKLNEQPTFKYESANFKNKLLKILSTTKPI